MEEKNRIHEELKHVAPDLARLKDKPGGMTTPPGYFENLSDRVIETIRQAVCQPGDKGEARVIGIDGRLSGFFTTRYIMAYAAALAVILTITFLVRNDRTDQAQYAEISAEDAFAYVTENLYAFDSELLMSTLGESDGSLVGSDLNADEEDVIYNMILDDIDLEDLESFIQ